MIELLGRADSVDILDPSEELASLLRAFCNPLEPTLFASGLVLSGDAGNSRVKAPRVNTHVFP